VHESSFQPDGLMVCCADPQCLCDHNSPGVCWLWWW